MPKIAVALMLQKTEINMGATSVTNQMLLEIIEASNQAEGLGKVMSSIPKQFKDYSVNLWSAKLYEAEEEKPPL
jgi:hypothetical protein